MEYKNELRQMVIQKLLGQGEICMVRFIAEQLIMEEMAKYNLRSGSTKGISEIPPIDILNNLSFKISKLSMEKGPFVYLSIKPQSL